jgi:hypothetical protein
VIVMNSDYLYESSQHLVLHANASVVGYSSSVMFFLS